MDSGDKVWVPVLNMTSSTFGKVLSASRLHAPPGTSVLTFALGLF